MLKKYEGQLSYRQWQQRNTDCFNKLSKTHQQQARRQGFFNKGWSQVKHSWQVLLEITNVRSLFDAKLQRGNLVGALDLSILEAEQSQRMAEEAINNLRENRKKIDILVETALNKHQLL